MRAPRHVRAPRHRPPTKFLQTPEGSVEALFGGATSQLPCANVNSADGPLDEPNDELAEDLEALNDLSTGVKGAASALLGTVVLWYTTMVGNIRRMAGDLGTSSWKDWQKWKPGQWALFLAASAVALLLIAAKSRHSATLEPTVQVVSASEADKALKKLDLADRAELFRLKHEFSVKREVDAQQLGELLSQEGLLEGCLEEAVPDKSKLKEMRDKVERAVEEAARKAAEEPPPQFWVERQWWKYRPRMPYTWLMDKVQAYEVESAVYSENMRHLYVSLKEGFPRDFVVDIPVDPFLLPDLKSHGVHLGMASRSSLFFLRGVAAVAPSLALLCLIGALQGRMQQLMNERMYDLVKMDHEQLILPEDVRGQVARKREAARERAKDGQEGEEGGQERNAYEDVVMGEEIWQALEEIMTYMRDPMKYYERGVKLPRGILLSGPPGTGKTLLARSMARQCGLPFVFASGAEFVDSTAQTGSEKVFNIFFTARANAPCFLFIDEIDALAARNVVSDSERYTIYQEFLNELDGEPEWTDVDRFSRRQAYVLIVATNRPQELDEQLLTPGRIDREIHVSLPSEAQRVDIFAVHSRDRAMSPDVDFSKLAFRTVGFSGADIRNLVNESSIMAVRRGHSVIEQEDLVAALDKQLFESLGVSMTEEEQMILYEKVPGDVRRLLAVHEAGHVLLAHLFPQYDWHAFTDILPAGQEKALSVFYPREDMVQQGYTTEGYLRMQMVVAWGGRCAERIVFGDADVTDASQDDLFKISRIARELACSAANPRLGLLPITMHPIMEPPTLPGEAKLIPDSWSRPGTQLADISLEMSEVFTREVTRYVDEAESMAMQALTENRHILDKLTDYLLQHYRISGLDAGTLIRSLDPTLLPDFLETYDDDLTQPTEDAPWNAERPARYRHLEIYPAPLHRC